MTPKRGRARVAIALVVLGSIFLPFACLTVWVRNLVLDTDRYVDTVAPLARDAAIQDALATRLSTELVTALDIEQRAAATVDLSRVNTKFVLIASDDLASVQSHARLLDSLAWVLPVMSLLFYAAAIVIAPRRRRIVIGVGVGVVIAMTVALVGYGLLRTLYLDGLPPTVHSTAAAAAAVFDTLTRFFQRALRTVLVIGLLTLLLAWLLGPSRAAVAIRRQWRRLGAGRTDAGAPGPVIRWVGAHTRGLQIAVLVAVLLLFVVWPRPTGLVVLFLAALALVGSPRSSSSARVRPWDRSAPRRPPGETWPAMISAGAEIVRDDLTLVRRAIRVIAVVSAIGIGVLEAPALRSPGSAAARLERIRAAVDAHRDTVTSWVPPAGDVGLLARVSWASCAEAVVGVTPWCPVEERSTLGRADPMRRAPCSPTASTTSPS